MKRLVVAALLIGSFLAGYKVKAERLYTADRIYSLFSQYALNLPSHKKKAPDGGVFDNVANTDYDALIQIHAPADVDRRRDQLTRFIWRGEAVGPAARRPDKIETDIFFPLLADLPNLGRIDRLTVTMAFGVTSVVFDLKPKAAKSCLMVYQEGHRASFLAQKRYLGWLLEAGCEVVALSLPLTGDMNNRPTIDHPRFGKIPLNDPDILEVVETASFSTIQYFLTPVAAALNHVLAEGDDRRVGMTGFSGGGWVTVLAAALDPRIQRSYSMSGSQPMTVHAARPGWGSYEQRLARLYEIADYPELYVMGAAGPGRRQIQGFTPQDPCCFADRNWTAYQTAVADRAAALGGSFAVVVDERSTRHALTKTFIRAILADFMDFDPTYTPNLGNGPPEAAPH